jgi:hypothetical protein
LIPAGPSPFTFPLPGEEDYDGRQHAEDGGVSVTHWVLKGMVLAYIEPEY